MGIWKEIKSKVDFPFGRKNLVEILLQNSHTTRFDSRVEVSEIEFSTKTR